MTAMAEIRTQLLFKAVFTLGATIELGPGPLGIRRMVPIPSGVFEGPKI